MPVVKNAPLLPAQTTSNRWPVMIFSHGLGGSRNAYSHVVGSIASHGMIVIAPEHRDGSAPISYIRDIPESSPGSSISSEKRSIKSAKRTVDYIKLAHTETPEVEAGRTAQLKIRLWELGLIHDALLKMDSGRSLTNLNSTSAPLGDFASKMAVHEPGTITFAGHSFGAATTAQLVKSTFYAPENSSAPASYEPIFTPNSRSEIVKQITPNTPVVLLDVWCFPLRAASTRWLWNKPMPCYAPLGPGGAALLAVESQAFYKWTIHLQATKRLLSPDPTSDSFDYERHGVTRPHFYYPTASAHLSQSDFGILFPWLTKKVFAAEEPERVMKLNVRAIMQLMRERGIEVSKSSKEDMESEAETDHDTAIFETRKGAVRAWNFLTTDVNTRVEKEEEERETATEPSQAVIGGELMDNGGEGVKA
jgi:platelet-activating factor acetylhydrolase